MKKIIKSPLNAVTLLMSVPMHYVMCVLGCGLVSELKYRLNWNVLKLAASMVGLSKEKKVENWLESYRIIERIAKLKASLLIYEEVLPKLDGTKELESFRAHITESLRL